MDGRTEECRNCRDPRSFENTRHLMYDCPLAKRILTVVTNRINDVGQLYDGVNPNTVYPLTLNPYMVLFHKLPKKMKSADKTDIEDVLMIVKHVLYALRCRDLTEPQPTYMCAMSKITSALQYHLRVLDYKVKSATLMRSLIPMIQNEAQMDQNFDRNH